MSSLMRETKPAESGSSHVVSGGPHDAKERIAPANRTPRDTDWLDRPVLLSGQDKAGTSLFQDLLDGHPEMFVLPDLTYFRLLFRRRYESARHMAADWLLGNRSILLQPRHPPVDFDPNDEDTPIPADYAEVPLSSFELNGCLRGLDGWEEHFCVETFHRSLTEALADDRLSVRDVILATTRAMLEACRHPYADHRWKRWAYRMDQTAHAGIYKTGNNRFNEIETFLAMFSKGQVLAIVRDPRAIVLSREDHFRSRRRHGLLARTFHRLNDAEVVRESFKDLLALQERHGGERLKIIRYEDLVTDTKAVTADICRFLGLSFSQEMLRPTLLGQPRAVLTAVDFDGRTVSARRADRWVSALSRFDLALIESILLERGRFWGSQWGYVRRTPRLVTPATRACVLAPVSAVARLAWWARRSVRTLAWPLVFGAGSCVRAGRVWFSHTNKSDAAQTRLTGPAPELSEIEAWYTVPNRQYMLARLSRVLESKRLLGFRRVLDVGARHGLFTLAFAREAEKVVALEPDQAFAELASERFRQLGVQNVEVVEKTFQSYEADRPFDLIHVRSVLAEDNLDRNEKLQSLIKLMSPGGRIYVSHFGLGQILFQLVRCLGERSLRRTLSVVARIVLASVNLGVLGKYNSPNAFMTRRKFKRFLKRNGLTIEYVGHVDHLLDQGHRGRWRFGPFIREHDALCKRNDV